MEQEGEGPLQTPGLALAAEPYGRQPAHSLVFLSFPCFGSGAFQPASKAAQGP